MIVRLGLALLAAYLAGSFPTAWLAGRALGVDPGERGSGNYGATNAFRTLGAVPGAIVLLVDVAKGFLPVLLLPRAIEIDGIAPVVYGLALAVAAVLGHVFSVFLGFRGGKGVGTAAGAYLALAPAAIGVAAVAWILVVAATRLVSLASLVGSVALFAGVILLDRPGGGEVPLVATTALLVAFVFWTHRANIGRLLRGEERPIARARGA